MLVIPENLVSEPSITRWELRALATNLVELVGQRPARLFSSKSFQMVPNGFGDRVGLRLSGQPCQLGRQPLCFSVSDVERHNYMYSTITILVASNVTLPRAEAGNRRCCTNRHGPARGPPTGSSPADAIRHWSAEGGHPIEDLTAEDGLTPLPGWTPGAKAIADDGLVAEERVLHPTLTMVP